MKKIKLLAIFTLLITVSCTKETEINEYYLQNSSYWEIITCDTEDNLIKINNKWLQNLNDENKYLQSRGFKLNDNQLEIVTTNGNKILQAELFNIDKSDLYITRPNDSTVVFYSTNPNLMNMGDVYYINLKIAD